MYVDFFNLREQPFGVAPDPAFLYLSRTHREALEALRSDLANDRGFMSLVGEPGLGKTTLLYKLLDEWRQSARVVFLFQTQCDSRELFAYILAELGMDTGSMGLVAMHQKLNQILFQEMLAGRRFVLIVDEAQNLDNKVLETIRLLSNYETQHAKLLNIVLAGQSQLADKLATPELRQLRQRIGLVNRLRPLTAAETGEYIRHRLVTAGHWGEPIFSQGALQAIAKASQGAPRKINNICHQILCAAAEEGSYSINFEMAQNVIAKVEGRRVELQPEPVELVSKEVQPAQTPAPASPSVVTMPAPPAVVAPTSARPTNAPAVFSYGGRAGDSGKPRSKRWGILAIAGCALMLGGAGSAVPSVRRFARDEYKSLISRAFGASSVSADVPETKPEAASDPAIEAVDPAPEDSEYGPVITVAPKTGETIEELSRVYTGHFDQQLYQQIFELNPDLKDPENLEAGQLIRLPVPAGSLKKVVDTDDPPKTAQQGAWETAVGRVKELLSSSKH